MTDRWKASQRAIGLVSGRWTLAVLSELAGGGRRSQDLHDALDGIAHRVLTETLRRAERDRLIARHLDAERIETAALYELTDLGRSLDELRSPPTSTATPRNASSLGSPRPTAEAAHDQFGRWSGEPNRMRLPSRSTCAASRLP